MRHFYLALFTLWLSACGADSIHQSQEERIGSLPERVIHPLDNPATEDKLMLGKLLFWDPVLSGNQDIACATCHHPGHGYTDQIDLSLGVGGVGLASERHSGFLIRRNAPTIVNTAFHGIDGTLQYTPDNTVFFWDNRAVSLEQQVIMVLKSGPEMRGDLYTDDDIIPVIVDRLAQYQTYVTLFEQAFGDGRITGERIAKAIAVFERSLVSNNSRFDQYARGDEKALTRQEIIGLNAFIEAGCTGCHSGPMLTDFKLHQLPVRENPRLQVQGIIDSGVDGKFRTPSLRNVSLTAPYMHNGSEASLRDAIVFYDSMENPSGSAEIDALNFTDVEQERLDAIEAFLRSLTDSRFDQSIPESVPSGLNPGGDI